MSYDFLLYGSTGYTGELVARQACQRGLRPLLAGRNADKLARQGEALNLPWRAFELSDASSLDAALQETGLVSLIAGPFAHTTPAVVEACLRTGAHYLDITGELDVYEWLWPQDARARQAGVMLVTGMGFDVVPTDCLAVHLKKRLPDAQHLRLAFTWRGPAGVSHGTLRSGLRMLPSGMRVRQEGKLVQVVPGSRRMKVDFGYGPVDCSIYPWGDILTAYYSTGIPNIQVCRPSAGRWQGLLNFASGKHWAAAKPFQSLANHLIGLFPSGASESARRATRMFIWGEVENQRGARVSQRLVTPEAYDFTALSVLSGAEKILSGEIKPGIQTPGMAFGMDFVLQIEGVQGWKG